MRTLFRTNKMILKGEIKTYLVNTLMPSSPKDPSPELVDGDKVHSIELDIIFQVNGNTVEFQYSFVLKRDESGKLTLKNWYEWFPVAELFFIMGYNFGENNLYQNPMIMDKWLNDCNPGLCQNATVENCT